MGGDSFNLEQSLWIRNAIADLMFDDCVCHIYNGGFSCLRCDGLQRAAQLFPIEHQQALTNVTRYLEKRDGVQS